MENKTIEQLNIEIENKKKELENLLNERKEMLSNLDQNLPTGQIWKPNKDKEYYYIEQDGTVYKKVNKNTSEDNKLFAMGNSFKTRGKGNFEKNRERYTRLFRQYVEQHSEPLDWGNWEQGKWIIHYDFMDKEIIIDENMSYQSAFQIYASSKEILQDAINFIGEDNFKKYILEVKE